MPDLEAGAPRADRDADASENHRARRGPVAAERVSKDRVAWSLDAGRARNLFPEKLPGLAVAPGKHADAAADVGLDAALAMSERQEADRRRERRDTQLDVLFDLGTIVVDEPGIDRGNRFRVEPHPQAGLEVLAEAGEPLGAEGGAVEV